MKRLFLIIFILLSGCSLLITKPEVTVKSVSLTGVDRKGVEMDFVLTVKNPNSYRLYLTGYRYDLLVSSILMSSGESHDEMEFAGNAVTDVRMPLRVEFQDVMKIVKATPDLDQIPYQLKAGLNMRTSFGPFTLPIDMHGNFALPRKLFLDRLLKQLR